jgi:hypothetical protein
MTDVQQTAEQVTATEKKYKGGVLIIGSLYWDDKRKDWRDTNLTKDKTKEKLVRTPIRYGKISSSRNHSYTMIFSKDCDNFKKIGTGRFVPFASEITLPQLHDQVIALIKAEQNKTTLKNNNYFWSWGSVCICLNPNLSEEDRQAITSAWTAKYGGEDENFAKYHLRDEKSILIKGGFLDAEWPIELYDADFFIATAVQPNVADYPKAGDLAALILKVPEQKKYFENNVNVGIRTFQDQVVNTYVESKGIHRENLHLLIYSLLVGSVLGTFIYDLYDVLLLGLQTPGSSYISEHGEIVLCKGSMFLGCLTFYISDYLNTTFVMGRRRRRIWADIPLLFITALTFKSVMLKSGEEPSMRIISLCYLAFLLYYMVIHWIDRKGQHKFYRDLFIAEVVLVVGFLAVAAHSFFDVMIVKEAFMGLNPWLWGTAGLMFFSSLAYAVFVWRRWDEDFAG